MNNRLKYNHLKVIDYFELPWSAERNYIQINNIRQLFIETGKLPNLLVNIFSDFISIFFCILPDADYSNHYESAVKWCTIDILLRDCFILKRLICKFFYSKQEERECPKFITVNEYFSKARETYYYGESVYSDSDSDDDQSEEPKGNYYSETLKKFNREYEEFEKQSRKQGFLGSDSSQGSEGEKSHSAFLIKSESEVSLEILIGMLYLSIKLISLL